ncbi:hypothetical protein ACMBCM_05450, partial [Spiroplasma sp. K1]
MIHREPLYLTRQVRRLTRRERERERERESHRDPFENVQETDQLIWFQGCIVIRGVRRLLFCRKEFTF